MAAAVRAWLVENGSIDAALQRRRIGSSQLPIPHFHVPVSLFSMSVAVYPLLILPCTGDAVLGTLPQRLILVKPRPASLGQCGLLPITAHHRPSPPIAARRRTSLPSAVAAGEMPRSRAHPTAAKSSHLAYRTVTSMYLAYMCHHTHTHHRVIRVRYFARARSTSSPCESVFERLCTAHL